MLDIPNKRHVNWFVECNRAFARSRKVCLQMYQLSLSIEEAKAATGLGRTKLYQLINSGELKAKKIGKRTIVLKDDLEAFLNGLQSYASGDMGA